MVKMAKGVISQQMVVCTVINSHPLLLTFVQDLNLHLNTSHHLLCQHAICHLPFVILDNHSEIDCTTARL